MGKIISQQDHEISLRGVDLIVKKGVFTPDPKITNSTCLILKHLEDISNKEILDLGCGTGILGIYCALNGAKKVCFTDIDKRAVENAKENLKMNNVGACSNVLISDLFNKIDGRFDYVFGNLPINDESWNLNILTIDIIRTFISQCPNHIKKGGKAYFTWNSDGDVETLRKFLIEKSYRFKEVVEYKLNKTWYLFEIEF